MLGGAGSRLEETPCLGEAEAGLTAQGSGLRALGSLLSLGPQDPGPPMTSGLSLLARVAVPSHQSGLNGVAPWDDCTQGNQTHLCE